MSAWCFLSTDRQRQLEQLLPRWQLKLQSLGAKCVASPLTVFAASDVNPPIGRSFLEVRVRAHNSKLRDDDDPPNKEQYPP
jgi:hypothetical protein